MSYYIYITVMLSIMFVGMVYCFMQDRKDN